MQLPAVPQDRELTFEDLGQDGAHSTSLTLVLGLEVSVKILHRNETRMLKFVSTFLVIILGLFLGLLFLGSLDPTCVQTYGKAVCDSK